MRRRGRVWLGLRRVLRPLETARVLAPQLLPERFRSRLKRRLAPVMGWLGASPGWQPSDEEMSSLRLPGDLCAAPTGPVVVWLAPRGCGGQRPLWHPGWFEGEGWPVIRVGIAPLPTWDVDQRAGWSGADLVVEAEPEDGLREEDLLERVLAEIGSLRESVRIRVAGVVCGEAAWEPLAERLVASFGWRRLPAGILEAPPGRVAEAWPRVSILMVTHGNPQVTRLCLDSVFAWTLYPNFEVVVVDNGSDAATREVLAEASERHGELTLVLNPDNRGFAAASNQAAALASGEILCLLNNDTVVTPGWLSVLAEAVASDRGLGMVGPVSNGVANEARVHPACGSLDELQSWAEGWVWRHHGETFSIPMLALFCAVMRREVWDEVGSLDEAFGLGMFEDDDYSRRLRLAGYDLACRRDSYVHHWQQMSFALLDQETYLELYERNRRYFRDKWAAE